MLSSSLHFRICDDIRPNNLAIHSLNRSTTNSSKNNNGKLDLSLHSGYFIPNDTTLHNVVVSIFLYNHSLKFYHVFLFHYINERS